MILRDTSTIRRGVQPGRRRRCRSIPAGSGARRSRFPATLSMGAPVPPAPMGVERADAPNVGPLQDHLVVTFEAAGLTGGTCGLPLVTFAVSASARFAALGTNGVRVGFRTVGPGEKAYRTVTLATSWAAVPVLERDCSAWSLKIGGSMLPRLDNSRARG